MENTITYVGMDTHKKQHKIFYFNQKLLYHNSPQNKNPKSPVKEISD